MIYITGDTHGDFTRFTPGNFPEQETMNRNDYVIILGDFGGIWGDMRRERKKLEQLNSKPFTTLFLDGNHENYDKLSRFPVETWHGGQVQRIKPNILHLMRGQAYNIDGKTFFTMGGAQSHDIEGGILNPNAPDFEEQYWALRRSGFRFRVNHISWWKQELPSKSEYDTARQTLAAINHKTDYILTHCAPNEIEDIIGDSEYTHDHLTDFLQEIYQSVQYQHWLCGHYHINKNITKKFTVLYEQIVRIL